MFKYCIYPFGTVEISENGNVYGCASGELINYSFGNIFDKSFNEIWNGESAVKFREQFIKKHYKYCNYEKCTKKKSAIFKSDTDKNYFLIQSYPKIVQIHLSKDISNIDKYFDRFVELLKNAKLVNINSKNEFFEDNNVKILIKKILKTYPEIKFAVLTNGKKCNKKHLTEYGLWDNLVQVMISPDIHNSLDIFYIEKTIQFLAKLRQQNKLKNFVIKLKNKDNYPKMKQLSEVHNFKILFFDKEEKKVCVRPFTVIEINPNGEVYTCCPPNIKFNSIGNIYNEDIEEIWNGNKAEELRAKIRCGDYSCCNLDTCIQSYNADISMLGNKLLNIPKNIVLAYDKECNLHCITCRDEKHINTQEEISLYDEKIYNKIKPILSNIENIEISSSGEAFFSRHSRQLIKQIASEYNHITWTIYTNGILFNTANCKELGIYGRISNVIFSLPAIDRKIYNKIMRGSDYDTVMKNIKEASEEYNKYYTIKDIYLRLVISVLNYKEIPKLVEFAKKNNFNLQITVCRNLRTVFTKNYKSLTVWDKSHPEYECFKKILKHPDLNYKKIQMASIFNKIRETE